MAIGFESVGGQSHNPSAGKALHVARMETGLFTNRSALHDPAQYIVSRFYGGYIDAWIDGSNMEVSNALTAVRRPGNSAWTAATYPTAPIAIYPWQRLDGTIQVMVDTATVLYRDNQDGTKTTVLTKSAGAGRSYMIGVGNWLYIGDGIDLVAYDGTTAWMWGIGAPTTAPTLTITETGAATTTWVASTVFSAMGIIVDGNGNIQQLNSVNASLANTTNYGTSGNGQPAWSQTPGLTTTDGAQTWKNMGPIVLWEAGQVYNNASYAYGGTVANPCIIYDPNSQSCYFQDNPGHAQGTSGSSYPNFTGGFANIVNDGTVKWFCLGTPKIPGTWLPSISYKQFGSVSNNVYQCGIVEPVGLGSGLPTNQTVYWQTTNVTANSGTGGSAPIWPPAGDGSIGLTTYDNDLIWMCMGSATRVINHTYVKWTASGTPFSAIIDSNSNIQICLVGGLSSSTATASIAWETGYGQTTIDGAVTWVCVGNTMSWAVNTKWYMPQPGFFPPQPSVPFGGASVIDSNNNVQFITGSGKSGSTAPSWSAKGLATSDGAATWYCEGVATSNSLSWTSGYDYAYSYGARLSTDSWNTSTPPGWLGPLGTPSGSLSGGVSTASPLATIIGGNPGAINTVAGVGSLNPAVDTIFIWRTLDGGSDLFLLTAIPNPPPIGGIAQPWFYQDFQIDNVLNELIPAPITDDNDPPEAGFLPMAYHFERIWGAVGQFVYCSGGGDTVTGNPNESYNPADYFEFPSPCTRLIPTATGILNFTTDQVESILGGPLFTTFFPSPAIPGIGLLHYDALDIHGGVIYLFSADKQFLSIDPSGGVNRMGGPIADKLASWDPTLVWVTVHESGNDNAIFISNGTTGWYRLNPCQFPNGNAVWSPFATITGGAGVVQSTEVTKGVHQLLIGPTGTNSSILKRDLSLWTDAGTAYTCYFTLGSINFCNPGQIAGLTFLNLRATKTGTTPTVGFLLNEISGTFTTFPNSQPYPWQIYGVTSSPSTLFSNAYYFRDAAVPALAEHAQFKVSFPAENYANEVLSMTIWGTIEQSPELF